MVMLISCLMESFPEWLASELLARGLSPADLSRLSGKAQAVISRILNNERKPAPETLEAIARALKLPPALVFEKAGLLPPDATADLSPIKRALIHLIGQSEDEDVEVAMKLLESLEERRNQKKTPTPRFKPAEK